MSFNPPLPAPIARYFAANPSFDVEGMLAPFAADAVVVDERQTRTGTDELRAWIKDATVGVKAISTPVSATQEEDRYIVVANVAGDFPGSPVPLTFRFQLAGEEISHLEIV